MTPTLALVRRDDLISDVDQISLLDYTDGIQVAIDGWQQAIADADSQSLTEAFTLRVKGSSQDNLAAKLQGLDAKLTQVYWYHNPQELYGVWLRAKLKNETNTRQALVTGARRTPAPIQNLLNDNSFVIQQYALALDRMPWWESTVALSYATTNINCLGGTWDYTTYGGSPGAVPGDQPGRIAQFDIVPNGASGPMTRFWMGFRTDRFGARANFVPTWDLKNAFSFGTDTTGAHADATAHSGTKVTCTFGTDTTLVRRVTSDVHDQTINYNDQRGTFIVLLRAQLTGAGSVNVRLADGASLNPNKALRPRVNVTATSWNLYELGVVNIPSPGRPVNGYNIANYSLAIDAEWISGVKGLDLDCLILVPIGEGYFTTQQPVSNGSTDGVFGGGLQMVMEKPDGSKQAIYIDVTGPSSAVTLRYFAGVPAGSGLVVVAGARDQSSVKADAINPSFQLYPRWNTLRGAS